MMIPPDSKTAQSSEKTKDIDVRPSCSHYTVIAEKTLFDVLGDVWRAKYMMVCFALIAALLAFLFIGISQRYTLAQMIIAPANPIGVTVSMGQGIEGTISAGDVLWQGADAFTVFGAIYNGTTVASFLAQDKEFLEALHEDHRFVFSKAKTNWDAQSLSEYLTKRVHLEPVSGSSSLRRLSYMHPDGKFAADLLKRIHRITDEMIRVRILMETNQRIAYLDNALAKTNNPDHKRSLTVLLMEQERQKMMVSPDQPYAASIIEPAYVSSRTHWPDPYLIYPAFVFIGLVIGYIVAVQFRKKQ